MKTNKVSKLLMLVLALAMCLSTITVFADDAATESTALPFADDFAWAAFEDKGVSTTEGAEYTFDQVKADTYAVTSGNIVETVIPIEDDPATEEDETSNLLVENENWKVQNINTGAPMAAWASAGTLKLRPARGKFSTIDLVKDLGEVSTYQFKVSAARTTKYQGNWDIDTGVRFSVSADGKSYYELRSNWARNMKFVKVVNGVEDSTTLQSTTGFNGSTDHSITMDVKVYGNLITWKCSTQQAGTIFEGSYTDVSPLTAEIPVQLIGRNGDGGTCVFDNFSIDALEPLPELPVYDDFAWATLTEENAVKVNTAGAYVIGNEANTENTNWQLSKVHTPGNNSAAWATDGSIKLRGKDGQSYTNINYANKFGNLSGAYNVKATAARTKLNDNWYDTSMGIRVAISADEKTFYQIISDRTNTCKIRFSKFVDGVEVEESVIKGTGDFGAQSNEVAFDVTVDNGTVYWTAIRTNNNSVLANGVYVDPAPIAITPTTIPVALVMSNSNAYTTFDNIAITNVKTAALPYAEDFANATLTSAGASTVYDDTYAALTPNKKLVASVDANGNKTYNDDFVTSAAAWRTDPTYGGRAFLMNGELYVRGGATSIIALANMAKKISGLGNEYKIEVNQRLNPNAIIASNPDWNGQGIIRFATSADEKTYYQMYRTKRMIQFSHFVNGVEVYTTELAGKSDGPDHTLKYTISVKADEITWDVFGITSNEAITSGSYAGSEENPLHTFNPATDIPVQLGGRHTGLACIYDNLKIDNIKKLPINDDFAWAASDSSTAVTSSAGTVVASTDMLGNKFYNLDYSLAENRGTLYAEGGKLVLKPAGGWINGASGWDYNKTLVNVNPVTNLTDEYKISVDLNRKSTSGWDCGMGIRFAISADKKSYCQLQVRNTDRMVKFYVVKNGTTVYETEEEGGTGNTIQHAINFAVTYRKGVVEYTLKDLVLNEVLTTGTYTDAKPVEITATSIPMQFFGNNNGMTVSMDNLVIENLEPLATGSIDVVDMDAVYFVNVTNPEYYGITDGTQFVYAFYNGNGELLSCEITPVDVSLMEENVLANVVLKDMTAGATGKAFFWNGMGTIAPLTPAIDLQ